MMFDHRRMYPWCRPSATNNDGRIIWSGQHLQAWPTLPGDWPHLVAQGDGEPAFLVGHSLGGILSLMCAARHPELARGVLLIDSPVLGGWRATTLGLAKRTALVGSVSPGRISQKRRHHWPDAQAALESFAHKKSFARWDPQVLRDYIEHGTHDEGGQRVLSFDRDIETAIYNSLPHKLDSLLKRHPLKCPVAFIGGTHSAEMRQAGVDLTHKVVKGRVMMIDGSHLFPMEKPMATAAAIEAKSAQSWRLKAHGLHAFLSMPNTAAWPCRPLRLPLSLSCP
jgi:pimeloyl-ACP methyl ester carboxylesterase